MPEETSSTSNEMSVDPADAVAELLVEENPDDLPAEDKKEDEPEGESEELESEDGEEEEEQEAEATEEDVTWAGVLGVDDEKIVLDEDGNLKGVNVKIDGEVSQVDVNTLIAGYQTAKSTTQKSQALAEARKQFEAQNQQASQAYEQRLNETTEFVGILQQKLMSDYEGIDWPRLRAENPAEYSATIQDLNIRKQDIAKFYADIQTKQGELQQERQNEFNSQRGKFISDHAAKIVEKHPGWQDRAVAAQAFKEMEEFSAGYGYSAEEFSQIVDSRAIEIIQDAMKYRNGKKLSEQKIVKKVPKFQKASTGRRKAKTSSLDKLVHKAKNAKGSSQRSLQTDAIAELLMSN